MQLENDRNRKKRRKEKLCQLSHKKVGRRLLLRSEEGVEAEALIVVPAVHWAIKRLTQA